MNRADRLREIVGFCDLQPRMARELCVLTGIPDTTMKHYTEDLKHSGRLYYCIAGPVRGWVTPRLWAELRPGVPLPDGAVPVRAVNVPLRPRWESGAVVVQHRKGVKITRAEPPRQRWATDVKPGQGVISGDWMMRRQGGEAPAGWSQYVDGGAA